MRTQVNNSLNTVQQYVKGQFIYVDETIRNISPVSNHGHYTCRGASYFIPVYKSLLNTSLGQASSLTDQSVHLIITEMLSERLDVP